MSDRAVIYDEAFFDWVDAGVLRSARDVLAAARMVINPKSVVDVGCGRGGWLAVWSELGAARVLGIDGAHVNLDRLSIPREAFSVVDLGQPHWPVDGRFDLAQSLEVAEHLPAASAESFVRNLVRFSDVVLFSAATPGQGGAMHVNEQEPEYWATLFFRHGYHRYDCIRPLIVERRNVEPWYRYNCFVYANTAGAARLESSALQQLVAPGRKARRYDDVSWATRRFVGRLLPRAFMDTLSRLNSRMHAWRGPDKSA